MIDAALVVALANAQNLRRPTHARSAMAYDALADQTSANDVLGPFLDCTLDARELPAVRALQRSVASLVDELIDGSEPRLEVLNALAAREPAIYSLNRQPDGRLTTALHPKRASGAATLLLAVIDEFSELEPARLRRCARPECSLVFYDTTRSATQRWHAERPCGLRERQRRHRDNANRARPRGRTPKN